jgi:hypothetical protein
MVAVPVSRDLKDPHDYRRAGDCYVEFEGQGRAFPVGLYPLPVSLLVTPLPNESILEVYVLLTPPFIG